MKAITKNKWFLALLGFLLLANIALLLSFFVFGEKHGDKPDARETRSYMARELNLNAEQEKSFKASKEAFFKEMEPLWESIRLAKDSLFRQVNNASITQEQIDDYTQRIAEMNRESDAKVFRHFQDLRKYCTPDQLVKFDTLVPRMMTRNSRSKK
jgi:periplasmic protein CpxP/Spy